MLQGAADLILLVHVLFVVFILGGLLLILFGGYCHWHWVRNPWFRLSHLLAIGIVVAQSWFGVICPLTTLEMSLRHQAGDATYGGTFIAHWLHAILYYEAPAWTFVVCYTGFGALVVLSWSKVRPRPFTEQPPTH